MKRIKVSNQVNSQHPQEYNPPSFDSGGINDEIDLQELFIELWHRKFWIIGLTILSALLSCAFAYTQPNIYKTSASLRVDADPYSFVESRGYNAGGLIIQEANSSFPYLASSEAKQVIISIAKQPIDALNGLTISKDREGYIIASKRGNIPESVFQSVTLYVNNINLAFKTNELKKVDGAIKATEDLVQSQHGKVKEVLAEKYAQLLFKKAILQSSDSELITVISEPVFPQSHIKPNRALIVILGTLLGTMLGFSIVFVSFLFRREELNG